MSLSPLPARASRHTDAANILREAIAAGTWAQELPGERDLCSMLQVSRPTLRKALHALEEAGCITPAAQGRRRTIQKPGKAVRATKLPASAALLAPMPLEAMPPFAVLWIDAVRARLAKAGVFLEVHAQPSCFTQRPCAALESFISRTNASAWILFRSNDAAQRWFASRSLPCVVAGSCAADVPLPSVDIDYRAACRHAGGMLLSAGHERLALLLPPGDAAGDRESEAGFREARPAAEATILRHDGSVSGICARLDAARNLRDAPTGFLIGRSVHTLTALTHLQRRGASIPRKAALISRDHDEFLDHVTPSIAHYRNDPAQMAKHVCRFALQLTRKEMPSVRTVRLEPEFVNGETLRI